MQNYCVYCMNPIDEQDVCPHCGKRKGDYNAVSHHLLPGTILGGKYQVGAVIGEGGFGITYIGRDINLDIRVAIKEYFPTGAVNRNNTSTTTITANVGKAEEFFEKGKNSFIGEARTLAKFSNEPSIVSVRDFFSENNTAYIVMEYLEGIDLKDYLQKNGRMTFPQVVAMLSPVMGALSKIHAKGLIHRDISPANIMILKDGSVKLLDFGAAREVSSDGERSLSILLKPGYAPEEQYRTKGKQGPWTDVYALSATMYKMLTGVTPDDAMNRIFSDDTRRICELNPSVTPEQEAIIFKGMSVLHANRFQTIAALHNACNIALSAPAVNQQAYVQPQQPVYRAPVQNNVRMPQQVQRPQPAAQQYQQPMQQSAVNSDKPAKTNKHPRVGFFIGFVIMAMLALMSIVDLVSNICNEKNPFGSIVMLLGFGVGAFFFGKGYFPYIDNKSRKPNIVCFILSILSALASVFFAFMTYVTYTDFWSDKSDRASSLTLTLVSLVFPVFYGYFYYPRLEKKKRKLFTRIYGGIGAAVAVIFLCVVIFTGLSTVTIGDQNISRGETSVSISFDTIPNSDLKKLKELKKLESLSIYSCFLDDEDVKTIGELTQLKSLSLSLNTDITDVSPLNNLTNLTDLYIDNTKTEDISCLDALVNLETLNIRNTNVSDLSVLEKYEALETLYMDSLDKLDVSTIRMPEQVRYLYCADCGIESLDFLSASDMLEYLDVAQNNISDLSPISDCDLYNLNIAANNISDLSPIKLDSLSDLDASTNYISDISCLSGSSIAYLDFAYNELEDITVLTDNYSLRALDISHNKVTDISCLKECFNLWNLDISYNQIKDISALATVDDLEYFNARSNLIEDISPLAECAKFIEKGNTLDLRDNNISDITALGNYVNTNHIYLSRNNISDITPLASCSSLEMVRLNNNNISDVTALNSTKKLRTIELVNNPVASLSDFSLPANSSASLVTLHITYNEGIDFEPLGAEDKLNLIVYDAPARQQEYLREYGLTAFGSIDNLDEIKANEDIPETEEENG